MWLVDISRFRFFIRRRTSASSFFADSSLSLSVAVSLSLSVAVSLSLFSNCSGRFSNLRFLPSIENFISSSSGSNVLKSMLLLLFSSPRVNSIVLLTLNSLSVRASKTFLNISAWFFAIVQEEPSSFNMAERSPAKWARSKKTLNACFCSPDRMAFGAVNRKEFFDSRLKTSFTFSSNSGKLSLFICV